MAGRLQHLTVFVCFIAALTSLSDAVVCHQCQRCEKAWSADSWQTVDCANGTCGKRVASGFTADVGPFKSTTRFCDDGNETAEAAGVGIGCRKRALNERLNGWLVKMSAVEECWCSTDYCNAATHVAPPTSMLALIAASAATLFCLFAL